MKKYKKVLFGLGLTTIASVSLITGLNQELSLYNSSFNKIEKSNLNNFKTVEDQQAVTTNAPTINSFFRSSNVFDENLSKQYYTSNSDNTSFAVLSSINDASGTSAQTASNLQNAISKFTVTPTTSNANKNGVTSTVVNEWSVKLSEIKNVISSSQQVNQVNLENLKINSILYSQGNSIISDTKEKLFILVSDDSKSYLLSKEWNATNTSKINSLNLIKTFNNKYNYMVEVDSVSQKIALLSLDNINNTTPQNYYYNLEKTNSLSYEIIDTKTPKELANEVSNSKQINFYDQTVLPKNSIVSQAKIIDGNLYLTLRSKNGTNGQQLFANEKLVENDTLFSIVKTTLTGDNINIGPSDIYSYKLTKEDISNGMGQGEHQIVTDITKDNIKLIYSGNQKTQKLEETKNPNKYKAVVLDRSNLNEISKNTYTLPNHTIQTGESIDQISPLYNAQKEMIGYSALSSDNKVYRLNNNLSFNSILYTFNGAAQSLGKEVSQQTNNIYFIHTRRDSGNWYALDTDATIGEFYNNNLLGQVGGTNNSSEIPVEFSFKTDNELSGEAKFYSKDQYDTFLKTKDSYKHFLNINSYDTRFDFPIIEVTKKQTKETGPLANEISLEFKQKLRNGSSEPKVISLGTKKYTLINGAGKIEQKKKEEVPYVVLNKKPSEITKDDVVNHLIKYENTKDLKVNLEPQNKKGVLKVDVTAPFIWINSKLEKDYTQTFVFGDDNNPFFKVDELSDYDLEITTIDQTKFDVLSEDIKSTYNLKYNSKLPSEISKKTYFDDFVKLGVDFTNPTLIEKGLIEPITENDITVSPLDREGKALIELKIRKLGDRKDETLKFFTPSIFKTDASANETVYFMFRTNEEVLAEKINDNNTFQRTKPSTIASLFVSNKSDPKKYIEFLSRFANFSSYFSNLIYQQHYASGPEQYITITPLASDEAGTLTINIDLAKPIDGLGSSISQTFTGFQGNNSLIQNVKSEFSFGDDSQISPLLNKPLSQITVADLETYQVLKYGGSAASLEKTITLNPIYSAGQLEVTVTFKNFVEEKENGGVKQTVITPIKTFNKVYSGWVISDSPIDMIAWKSIAEMDPNYKNLSASSVVTSLESKSKKEILSSLAYLTPDLEVFLSDSANEKYVNLSIVPNDVEGTISVYGTIIFNGIERSLSVTISGFVKVVDSYTVLMVSDTSSVLDELKATKLPSQITDEDILKFYSTQSGSDLQKKIIKKYDDTKGTLSITIELYARSGPNSVMVSTTTGTYSGFLTNVPKYSGTNWLIVGLSIAIPTVVLLIPILYIVLIKNRSDIRKFNKKLDSRIAEESKRKPNKEIKSIKDLLDL